MLTPAPHPQSPSRASAGEHLRASDRLLARVAKVGSPVCVGLDPVLSMMPKALLRRFDDPTDDALAAKVLASFCTGVLQAVKDIVPVVKIQVGCFERYGGPGMMALGQVLAQAREHFETILDAKRGDIGVTADHYAHAARHALAADWVTVNSYLGTDSLAPFVGRDAAGDWHGAFALVRTSNPSGDQVQALRLEDGRTVGQAVADMVAKLGEESVGQMGYSDLGAVVGATRRTDAAELRTRMPRQIFLVPGFGAQGGGVDDVLPCFNTDGRGAIVTASRSVIYAFRPEDAGWQDAVGAAARDFHGQIARGLGLPGMTR